jgi:hypothetical protein
MFPRLAVVLDEQSPGDGAFVHALEWASCLKVPLRIALVRAKGYGVACLPAGTAASGAEPAALKACAVLCAQKQVAWEADVWDGPRALDVPALLDAGGLCVFGQALPAALRDELLRGSLRAPRTAALIATRLWQPMRRVLILNHGGAPASPYLTSAARVCRAFECAPVVLTVARSEPAARQCQRAAEAALAAEGLAGDFDLVVGCEVRAAVALAAQCRRCTHVVVEKPRDPSWWRRLRGDVFVRLLGLGDELSFLALPGAGAPAAAERPTKAAAGESQLSANPA